ncbi:PQQ-binding-like beta-propeller repeat protein [Streptacidiphilus sp. MAP5-52]|uniref:outer membrane protein assembly factor BamB family protein n=1 Tax=Streptacidiphilus sp. MAP5-52 TaxID=3156267 RepID=UPI003513F896
MQIVDARSGHMLLTVAPSYPPAVSSSDGGGYSPIQAPGLAEVRGRTLAFAPFGVSVPGQGTTPGYDAVQIVAVDTTLDQRAWTATFPDASGAAWGGAGMGLAVTLVGVQGDVAIISVTTEDHASVYAFDLATRKLLWEQDNFMALALAGDEVIGSGGTSASASYTRQQVTALGISNGQQRWSQLDVYNLKASTASPTLIAVTANDYNSGHGFLKLLNAATGATVQTWDGDQAGTTCTYDGIDTSVCSSDSAVFAVNPTTGALMWQLPDTAANRIAPTVTTVWHGLIYGTTASGPVVLDAKTGKDRNDSPGVAPSVVDSNVAIALDPSGTDNSVRAFAATG